MLQTPTLPCLPTGAQQKVLRHPQDQGGRELLLPGSGLLLPGVAAGEEQRGPQVSGAGRGAESPGGFVLWRGPRNPGSGLEGCLAAALMSRDAQLPAILEVGAVKALTVTEHSGVTCGPGVRTPWLGSFLRGSLRTWRAGWLCRGAGPCPVLCGMFRASLAFTHEMLGAPSSSQDNPECLHTLPGSPGTGKGRGGDGGGWGRHPG